MGPIDLQSPALIGPRKYRAAPHTGNVAIPWGRLVFAAYIFLTLLVGATLGLSYSRPFVLILPVDPMLAATAVALVLLLPLIWLRPSLGVALHQHDAGVGLPSQRRAQAKTVGGLAIASDRACNPQDQRGPEVRQSDNVEGETYPGLLQVHYLGPRLAVQRGNAVSFPGDETSKYGKRTCLHPSHPLVVSAKGEPKPTARLKI